MTDNCEWCDGLTDQICEICNSSLCEECADFVTDILICEDCLFNLDNCQKCGYVYNEDAGGCLNEKCETNSI